MARLALLLPLNLFFVSLLQAPQAAQISDPGVQCLLQHSRSVSKAISSEALKTLPGEHERLDGDVRDLDTRDWLYSASVDACRKPNWDITQYAFAVRLGLPIVFIVLMGFVVLHGRQEDGHIDRCTDSEEDEKSARRYDLDYARIICVACVVTEHSGGTHWTKHNIMFVLQWVLPFLYITSAVSWMMSKKDVCSYVSRLVVVLAVGVGANWIADAVTGRNWHGDFGNTVFQMFYVVMLIAMSTATVPLRQALRSCRNVALGRENETGHGWLFYLAFAVYGLITVAAFVGFWLQKRNEDLIPVQANSWYSNMGPILQDAPVAFVQIGGTLFLCHLACIFKANDVFPWLLLIYVYLPRIFAPWEKVGFLHNLELFVFAMVAESWTLKGFQSFKKVVQNYWPILIFVFMIATMPDMYGRCDLMPPTTVFERIRFYGVEMFLSLFLVTGSIKLGDPYNVTEWLNYWALYAYCFHVAWARLFPIPYGAVLTYGSAVVVYLAWRSSGRGEARFNAGSTKDATGGKLGTDAGRSADVAGGG